MRHIVHLMARIVVATALTSTLVAAQEDGLEELRQQFDANPVAAFQEAERMLAEPLAAADVDTIEAIIVVARENARRWDNRRPLLRMASAAAPVARAAGRWKVLGDLYVDQTDDGQWSSMSIALSKPGERLDHYWLLLRHQHLLKLASDAYARAGHENPLKDRLQTISAKIDQIGALAHRIHAETVSSTYAEQLAAGCLAAGRCDDETALKGAIALLERGLPDALEDRPWSETVTDLSLFLLIDQDGEFATALKDAIRRRQWEHEHIRNWTLISLARNCALAWEGGDDVFQQTYQWAFDAIDLHASRPVDTFGFFVYRAGRLGVLPDACAHIARRFIKWQAMPKWAGEQAVPGAFRYARADILPAERRALLHWTCAGHADAAVDYPDVYGPEGLASRVREWVRYAPPESQVSATFAAAEEVAAAATEYSEIQQQADAFEEAATLWEEIGQSGLAAQARAAAEAVASQDPEALMGIALTRARSAAGMDRWEDVVTQLEPIFADAGASSKLAEAGVLLAKAHLELEDPTSAGQWYRRASEAIDHGGLSSAEQVGYLKSLAALADDEDWKIRMLERARAAADASGLETLQDSVARQLAEVALEAGRLDAAESALIELIDRSEEKRHRLALDPRLRQEWFADHIGPYRQLARVAALQADAELALACGERMRSRALIDQLAWKQVDLEVDLPQPLRQRLADLRTMRRSAYSLLTKIMGDDTPDGGQPSDEGDERGKYMPVRGVYMPVRGLYMPIRGPLSGAAATTEDAARLTELLDDLAAEEKALEGAVREQVPAYARAAQTALPSGAELAGAVAQQPGLAVLHYTFADEGLAVTSVCGDDLRVRLIEIDQQTLYDQVGQFREAIWEQSDDAYIYARELYQTLVRPVESVLPDADRLWVVADGIVQLVPFSALIDGHNDYLGQRIPIAFAPSLTLALSSRGEREAPSHDAVVVAAPETGARQIAMADASEDDSRGLYMPVRGMYMPVRGAYMPIRGEGEVSSALTAMAMVPLPEAKTEGEAVVGLYENASLLTGADATKSALGQAGADCDVLHIATHGYADPDFPDFSGLLLSAPEGSETAYQVLTAGEVYAWPLKARLVTLSACQTALGKDVEGEGILGLSRAFIYAGAQHVVCSLWPVSDASTCALMTAFYEALNSGASVEEALQAGQNALPGDGDTAHPFYWAGFIAVRGPG